MMVLAGSLPHNHPIMSLFVFSIWAAKVIKMANKCSPAYFLTRAIVRMA